MKRFLLVLSLFLFGFTLAACAEEEKTHLEVNPYANVDWATFTQVLANLHTHTDADDGHGAAYPCEAVDIYHDLGYGALALTDHDLVTWPWNFSAIDDRYADRDPDALGMLAIPGNEFSRNHHFVGLFTTYEAPPGEAKRTTMDKILAQDEDALMFFAHPGRYWELEEAYEPTDRFSPGWYLDFYDDYAKDELAGIEVFNTRDRYPDDRHLWDRLLQDSMPERPIWGFATDDFHGEDLTEANWSMSYHLMADSSCKEEFRATMIEGAFYIAFTRDHAATPPLIEEIIVDEDARTIEIKVDGDYDEIRWKSGVSEETGRSIIVERGAVFSYGDFEGAYVRAEIVYDLGLRTHAKTLTQPFGFIRED